METLEAIRIQKLKQIRDLGYDAYPTSYRYTHSLAQVSKEFGAKTSEELEQSKQRVRVAGRILTNRPFGKAGFITLSDGEGQLQAYAKKDQLAERDFQLYKHLDIGDFIGVEGTLFRTRTGELTVLASAITFLAKSFLPLPEKWHGLTDVEIRYRRRYVDLVVNREVRDVFVKRSLIVRELRRFLDERGYFEVETPILHPIAGGALAKPFKTHHNALDMQLYLRIAPELYLKRLIVGGLNRVYDLNRNFRNEGISFKHNPEFTMLEFYCAYMDVNGMMDFCEELIACAVQNAVGGLVVQYEGKEIDFRNINRISMREAVARGGNPSRSEGVNAGADTLPTGRVSALSDAELLGIFEERVEPALIQPTFIVDFPKSISPLSKASPNNPQIADRFEL